MEELTTQIPELKDQIRLLRMALDEFHTDFMWAVHNVVATIPTPQSIQVNSLPGDLPTGDPAKERNGNAEPDESSAEKELSKPSSPRADAAQCSIDPGAEQSAPEPGPVEAEREQQQAKPRRPGQASQPLYMRIMQRHMTDVFRAIGYDELSYVNMNRRLEPLAKHYTQQKIDEAVRELTESVPRKIGFFRLSAAARPFALQLLGPPGTAPLPRVLEAAPLPADGDSNEEKACDVTITLPREQVIEEFKAWLKDANRSFTPLTTETIQGLKRCKVLLPDGIVDGTELVTLRQMLSTRQRGDMKSWLTLIGRKYEAVRVWPTSRGEGNWNWTWEVVATSEDKAE